MGLVQVGYRLVNKVNPTHHDGSGGLGCLVFLGPRIFLFIFLLQTVELSARG